MNEQDRPTRHPAVETAVFEAEVVVFDERSGVVHHLNPSASAIWLLLDGRPLGAVIDALSETTGEARNDLRPDVLRAVAQLRDVDLISD